MKKIVFIAIIVALLLLNIFQFAWDNLAHRLFTDAVPDERTARAIAEAVLTAAFGEGRDPDSLNVVYLSKKKAWMVYKPIPEGYLGGGLEVMIRQRDGKIMELRLL